MNRNFLCCPGNSLKEYLLIYEVAASIPVSILNREYLKQAVQLRFCHVNEAVPGVDRLHLSCRAVHFAITS